MGLKNISLLIMLLLLGCISRPQEQLTIAAAANMQFPLESLEEAFEKQTGIGTTVILGSSGKLFAQIQAGAPYDLYLSADLSYPELLHEAGQAKAPMIYAFGKLVFWQASNETSLESLAGSNGKIAIANPKTAPYGIAAMEVLRKLPNNETITSRLVYGENINQANQFIQSGAVKYGFTSKSVVLSDVWKSSGTWLEVDSTLYSPVAQGMAVLTGRKKFVNEADQFQKFLSSKEGKEILRKFGYTVPR